MISSHVPRKKRTLELIESFENGRNFLNNWGVESVREDSLALVNDPKARIGSTSLKFNIRPTDIREWDKAEGKNRIEIKHSNNHVEGDTAWYSWSFYIPSDYIDSTDPNTSTILGQIGDLPLNPSDPLSYHHPTVAVNYSIQGIAINYGVKDVKRSFIVKTQIKKGQWNDIIFHVHWSKGNDGWIRVHLNGKELTSGKYYGPNKYDSTGNQFKLGIYRSSGFTSENNVFYDNIKIWKK